MIGSHRKSGDEMNSAEKAILLASPIAAFRGTAMLSSCSLAYHRRRYHVEIPSFFVCLIMKFIGIEALLRTYAQPEKFDLFVECGRIGAGAVSRRLLIEGAYTPRRHFSRTASIDLPAWCAP
jgi:hypothetical protein